MHNVLLRSVTRNLICVFVVAVTSLLVTFQFFLSSSSSQKVNFPKKKEKFFARNKTMGRESSKESQHRLRKIVCSCVGVLVYRL